MIVMFCIVIVVMIVNDGGSNDGSDMRTKAVKMTLDLNSLDSEPYPITY